jgi:putative spermidine/putrescine transport system permease protein
VALLIVPAGLLTFMLLVGPMLWMGRISLNEYSVEQFMIEALTLQNYVKAIVDPYYLNVLAVTFGVALLCTALTLLLALPVAYALARTERSWKSLMVIVTLFPLLVGNVVRSAGWMAILGKGGLINYTLRLLDLPEVKMMYTTSAVVIGIVAVVLPYMILTLCSVIESIPRNLEEAAENLGARRLRTFVSVLWPLMRPGVAAGSVLVFVLCMNTYATAVLLGGPQFKMMAPAVYDQFVIANNWPFGAALAFILLAMTLLFTVAGSMLLARRYHRK